MKEKEVSEIPEEGNFFDEIQNLTCKEATDRAGSSNEVRQFKVGGDDSATMNYTNC